MLISLQAFMVSMVSPRDLVLGIIESMKPLHSGFQRDEPKQRDLLNISVRQSERTGASSIPAEHMEKSDIFFIASLFCPYEFFFDAGS